jgi:hypothetical protein
LQKATTTTTTTTTTEHVDRLAKVSLKRVVKHPLTLLSYIKRKAKEEILA